MSMVIKEVNWEAIQKIREEWNSISKEELEKIREYSSDSVNAYQFWLELKLVNRATSEFSEDINAR